ncbi:MAG: type II toxin-antitoxin system RelE/ParE family toxin [Actinobacteria bacterium]|nr:type II toxin-antitoxin system RelE/ParE family toxin [Actinomycetota bacterium]
MRAVHRAGAVEARSRPRRRRVRAGDFRVGYFIDDSRVTVWVLRVAHRREVCQR